MSLRARVNKLIENRQAALIKNVFIIGTSKQQEEEEIAVAKNNFTGDLSLLMITVFRIYE